MLVKQLQNLKKAVIKAKCEEWDFDQKRSNKCVNGIRLYYMHHKDVIVPLSSLSKVEKWYLIGFPTDYVKNSSINYNAKKLGLPQCTDFTIDGAIERIDNLIELQRTRNARRKSYKTKKFSK